MGKGPTRPKMPPQTFDESCASEMERKRKKKRVCGNVSSVYKGEVMDDSPIGNIVSQLKQEFIEGQQNAFANKKSILNRPIEVFEQIKEYFDVCVAVRKPPDMTGLAKKFGITRDALYSYMRTHPDTETTSMIKMFEDSCTEAMTRCAYENSINPIVAIFTLKARYGFKEASEVLVTNNNPMGELKAPEEIAEKYSYLPAADVTDVPVSDVIPDNVIEVVEDGYDK